MRRESHAMDFTPPMCRCGESQAARQDVRDNFDNPRCQICRAIAMLRKDWTPERVAAAGRRKWQIIAAKGAEARKRRKEVSE